mmetsp:Transcript_23617/g.76347  ORF Transcript_23617/g.76347 Transcript_23617/m.76347 type:complete len:231 (-) Transcript_23617:376-1068(-)
MSTGGAPASSAAADPPSLASGGEPAEVPPVSRRSSASKASASAGGTAYHVLGAPASKKLAPYKSEGCTPQRGAPAGDSTDHSMPSRIRGAIRPSSPAGGGAEVALASPCAPSPAASVVGAAGPPRNRCEKRDEGSVGRLCGLHGDSAYGSSCASDGRAKPEVSEVPLTGVAEKVTVGSTSPPPPTSPRSPPAQPLTARQKSASIRSARTVASRPASSCCELPPLRAVGGP